MFGLQTQYTQAYSSDYTKNLVRIVNRFVEVLDVNFQGPILRADIGIICLVVVQQSPQLDSYVGRCKDD